MNAARLWAYLTAVICNLDDKIDNDIPDNKYFLKYGPDYELKISPRNLDDANTENDLERIYQMIKGSEFRVWNQSIGYHLMLTFYTFTHVQRISHGTEFENVTETYCCREL